MEELVINMRKILLLIVLVFTLTSCETEISECEDSERVLGVCVDVTKPVIEFDGDIDVPVGTKVDLLDGVTATDDIDGDVTNDIIVESQLNKNLAGTYFIKYIVNDDAGNEAIAVRYVTFSAVYVESDNLVLNGGFTNGMSGFNVYEIDGSGDANFDVVDGVLEIELLSLLDDAWYVPRLDYGGMMFEQDSTYKVTFRAKADEDRFLHVQVGELLSASPWFDGFDSTGGKVFTITQEFQEFEFIFTMQQTNNSNGSILFELVITMLMVVPVLLSGLMSRVAL